ncbi:hypothetical protein [Nocardioides jensenii]|uniref:hypothetical protein n=1 Tax=Nocardioides jensenii TaxID=1843 RepID=UPI0012F95702|nr:hypothetical protein [Nocardioides jensenii]
MVYVVLGLAALAALSFAAVTLMARRRTTPVVEPHRLWAVASANTADGVTAHLGVDFVALRTASATEAGPVSDAVEDLLRHRIASSPARSLPSVGDEPGFLVGHAIGGTTIERAVVTASEVEVTPQFRRLIGAPD